MLVEPGKYTPGAQTNAPIEIYTLREVAKASKSVSSHKDRYRN